MQSQGLYNLVFSNHRASRWKRHFLFWLAVFIYHIGRIGLVIYGPDQFWQSPLLIFKVCFMQMFVNMVCTYTVVYYLIPKYFRRKKYVSFIMGLFMLFWLLVIIQLFNANVLNKQFFLTAGIDFQKGWQIVRTHLIRQLGNPPLICGLFLSLKILKNWHLEQLQAGILAKENANAELQLLKAQIHPHFLFNTLNNIYSFALYQSPETGTLVKKLSGMLRYMINECDERLVPLEKELSLVKDYMDLEKVRYGQRLNMQVEIHGDFENKLITPLLMIPFIENSFKHGTSQMLRHPWIKLEITTVNNQLFLKLSNSKPSIVSSNGQSKGIGLLNVKKRLELLYPEKHQLDISTTEEMFTVNMQLLLEEYHFANNYVEQKNKTLVYAG